MTISVAGTVEIDLQETNVMKKAKKPEADITQSSAEDVEVCTKTTKPQKTPKKKTIEVSVCKGLPPNEQTKNKVGRPMIEAKPAAGKPPQSEIESRREKDEVNVEIRQKPVFGRRSIISKFRSSREFKTIYIVNSAPFQNVIGKSKKGDVGVVQSLILLY
ncbi:hypothetical protein KIN20_008074 [Parelaphostrongylus tenuis]|uniref:Uncharacterized protein n=1 Tax=Parelaphostrongylus tenuis TaxID=148309 RepID=A0AAD5M479_PARTN|nr:hypothetical protein KIN20_008074 [Parelaphostrongylus tenuis]